MSFTVRIFGLRPMVRVAIDAGQQGGTDSVLMEAEPYLWTQQLTASGAAASSTVFNFAASGFRADPTVMLRVEVPDGQTIRYEVNGGSRNIAATSNSKRMNGITHIPFAAGNTISIIDAVGTT